jgi:hypothetical protein
MSRNEDDTFNIENIPNTPVYGGALPTAFSPDDILTPKGPKDFLFGGEAKAAMSQKRTSSHRIGKQSIFFRSSLTLESGDSSDSVRGGAAKEEAEEEEVRISFRYSVTCPP